MSCDINLSGEDVLEDFFDNSTLVYTSNIDIENYPVDSSVITLNKNRSVSAYYYSGSDVYKEESITGDSETLLSAGYSNFLADISIEEDLNLLIEIDGALRYRVYLNDKMVSALTNLVYMVTGNFEITFETDVEEDSNCIATTETFTIDTLTIKYASLAYNYSDEQSVEIYLTFDTDDDIEIILTDS